ncbi:hypothetical protein FK545_11815 [Planococcus glaciei]|nr:hypothetical protein [Planococcus glaciei]QDY45873.1 hypothetical protein FK545_11815 [Planococcus glaciei]
MAKLKVSELKQHLKSYSNENLIRLIVELSKTSKEAQNFLAAEVQGEAAVAELHEEAKTQIQDEFFPRKRGAETPPFPGEKKRSAILRNSQVTNF